MHVYSQGHYCATPLSHDGLHAATCSVGGWRISLHNQIRNLLAWAAIKAGCKAHIEVVNQALIPLAGQPPEDHDPTADVHVWNPSPNLDRFLDVVVSHPLAPSYLSGSANFDGHTNSLAANEKLKTYGKLITPCPIETYGRIGPSLLSFLNELEFLANSYAKLKGLPRTGFARFWQTKISFALARALHASHDAAINARRPPPYANSLWGSFSFSIRSNALKH